MADITARARAHHDVVDDVDAVVAGVLGLARKVQHEPLFLGLDQGVELAQDDGKLGLPGHHPLPSSIRRGALGKVHHTSG
jgi:hypothetical protein